VVRDLIAPQGGEDRYGRPAVSDGTAADVRPEA
jgi:hypothetical protein